MIHQDNGRRQTFMILRGFGPTAEIELLALFSEGKTLVSSLLLEPTVQLVLLAAGLSGIIATASGFDDRSYITFVFPGILALQAMRAFSRTMYRTVLDRQWGMLTVKRLAGVSGSGYALGKTTPSLIVLLLQSVVLFAIALLMGSRFDPLRAVMCVILASVSALFWAGLAMIVTAYVRDYVVRDAVVTWMMLPLGMAAPVFYPLTSAPGYIQAIARVNPLAYQVDAMRAVLLHGQWTTSAAGLVVASVAMTTLAILSVGRGDALTSEGGR